MKKAMELYEEASRGGDLKATFNLGVLHQENGNMKKAMELWEVASRSRDLKAKFCGRTDNQQLCRS